MNVLIATVWILTANFIAAIIYPKVSNLSGAALYLLAGNLIVVGWIYGALTKAPLSVLGPALGAGFPLVCLAVGWWSGETLPPLKLALLLGACGLVVAATVIK